MLLLLWVYLMATTIVSNLAVFSDSTGHGNQRHLVYAANQGRWWAFNFNTKTATVVKCYVSSSNDLSTATWSAGTDSPDTTLQLDGSEHRNLATVEFANGSTDVVHVSICTDRVGGDGVWFIAHIRAKFTGSSSITWESWDSTRSYEQASPTTIKGNALGLSTDGFVHEACTLLDNVNQRVSLRKSTNADTSSSWTSGFGSSAVTDTLVANSVAIAKLAGGAMLAVYENSGGSFPNCNGLRYNVYTSGATWPTVGSGDVGIGTSTQDSNDWCLCEVDTTHIYVFRRDSSNSYKCRMFDGSSWSTPTSTVANQDHLAGSGLFAASDPDGTSMYLFAIDSASNGPIYYTKGSTANGTITFDSGWTLLEAAGSTARNYISGFPLISQYQIGVIFTAVNGSNFDINVSALSFPIPPSVGQPGLPAAITRRQVIMEGQGCW